MATYSFLDVHAAIAGPGGSFQMGSGAGAAEEGISVADTEDRNTMLIGADGQGMHSLHAGKSGNVTVRLLKTSPVNAQLEALFNLQSQSSAAWGQNVITINDTARGDVITCRQVAFTKRPDLVYAKAGNVNEWSFQAIKIDRVLGRGSPEA